MFRKFPDLKQPSERPDEPGIWTRRKVLATLSGLLFLGKNSQAEIPCLHEADPTVFFKNFPEALNGAKDIKKYPTLDAKQCLVHIRQRHLDPFDHNDSSKDELVRTCQYDIYRILTSLIDQFHLDYVYLEGGSGDIPQEIPELQKIRKSMDEYKMKQSELLRAHELGLEVDDQKVLYYLSAKTVLRAFIDNYLGVQSGYTHEETRVSDDKLLLCGAAEKLYVEGKLKTLIGAERMEANRKTLGVLEGAAQDGHLGILERKKIRKTLLKERENIALEVIASRGDPVAVMVYGGLHEWEDNIQRWNRKYPGHTFSLIEITPESLVINDDLRI